MRFEKSTSGHSLLQKISLNDKSGRNAENYSFHSSFLEVPLLARRRCECSFLAFFSILWRNAAVNMQAIAIYLWCYIATTMTVKYSQTSIFINLQNMYKISERPMNRHRHRYRRPNLEVRPNHRTWRFGQPNHGWTNLLNESLFWTYQKMLDQNF